MSINESRSTATVIPFPLKRRREAMAVIHGVGTVLDLHPASWPVVECGSGWYHEAAMRDVDRVRK